MAAKGTLGRDLKEFYNADWDALVKPGMSLYIYDGGAYPIGSSCTDADCLDIEDCADDERYRLEGLARDQSATDSGFSISLSTLYRRWKLSRDTVVISVRVSKLQEAAMRDLIIGAGGKLL